MQMSASDVIITESDKAGNEAMVPPLAMIVPPHSTFMGSKVVFVWFGVTLIATELTREAP